MFKINSSNRIIYSGILIVIIQTFSGSSFDAITKLLGSSSKIIWYHYYAIGLGFSLFLFLSYLFFIGQIKKHIILKNKNDYIVPLIRGITFIPIPIIKYFLLLNVIISCKIPQNFFPFIFISHSYSLLSFLFGPRQQ